jgi:hypothetical protein
MELRREGRPLRSRTQRPLQRKIRLIRPLPKIAEAAAHTNNWQRVFKAHTSQTKGKEHAARQDPEKPRAPRARVQGVAGLIKEGQDMIGETARMKCAMPGSFPRRKVEHYEMAGCGGAPMLNFWVTNKAPKCSSERSMKKELLIRTNQARQISN